VSLIGTLRVEIRQRERDGSGGGLAPNRVCLDAATLVERVGAFGVTVNLPSLAWTTAYGDLHWGNLTTPQCWLLDWEA
jgi:hypothetical protein